MKYFILITEQVYIDEGKVRVRGMHWKGVTTVVSS